MKKINFFDLDGRLLRAFLVILEESSVSKAANRLDVTQSAVSHMLARLRMIMGDPLFIRSGQGLVPTAHARSLRKPVQQVMDDLKSLTVKRELNLQTEELVFRLAANDMQRELIFPRLFREARAENISLNMEFIPSGVPNVELLRDGQVELVLTPLPPDAPDIFLKKLLVGNMSCYFDATQRDAPKTVDAYKSAEHIQVKFVGAGTSFDVISRNFNPRQRNTAISVSNFNAITSFVKGTTILATEMDLMKLGPLRDLDVAPLPFQTDPVSIYMVWHERSNKDPAHIWLRNRIETIAAAIAGDQAAN